MKVGDKESWPQWYSRMLSLGKPGGNRINRGETLGAIARWGSRCAGEGAVVGYAIRGYLSTAWPYGLSYPLWPAPAVALSTL
jgi:hypothetical protein